MYALVLGDVEIQGTISASAGTGAFRQNGGSFELLSGGNISISGTVDVSGQENWVWENGTRKASGSRVTVKGENVAITGNISTNGGSGGGQQYGGTTTIVAASNLSVSGTISADAQDAISDAGIIQLTGCTLNITGLFTPTPETITDCFVPNCDPPCQGLPDVPDTCIGGKLYHLSRDVCIFGICGDWPEEVPCPHPVGCIEGESLCYRDCAPDPGNECCIDLGDVNGYPIGMGRDEEVICALNFKDYSCDGFEDSFICGGQALERPALAQCASDDRGYCDWNIRFYDSTAWTPVIGQTLRPR